jgi:hypothetical protein
MPTLSHTQTTILVDDTMKGAPKNAHSENEKVAYC